MNYHLLVAFFEKSPRLNLKKQNNIFSIQLYIDKQVSLQFLIFWYGLDLDLVAKIRLC